MDNTIAADLEVAEVKFVPPLHEQRRSWALEILRREGVPTVGPLGHEIVAVSRLTTVLSLQVLDVGCGEGVFLQHLTHAPPWRAYTSETPAPPVFEKPDFIHVRELHGLDILHDDLVYAAEITGPSKHAYGWTRFEQLDVSIWEGGLQAPNPAFKGIECIVATEVYALYLRILSLADSLRLELNTCPRMSWKLSPQSYWAIIPLASSYSPPRVINSMSASVPPARSIGASQILQAEPTGYFAMMTTNSSGQWTNASAGARQRRSSGVTTSLSTVLDGL